MGHLRGWLAGVAFQCFLKIAEAVQWRVVIGVSRRPRNADNLIGRSNGGCKRLTEISAMALVTNTKRENVNPFGSRFRSARSRRIRRA
jgi:hypothetical protein